jgi:hypothetical protein
MDLFCYNDATLNLCLVLSRPFKIFPTNSPYATFHYTLACYTTLSSNYPSLDRRNDVWYFRSS